MDELLLTFLSETKDNLESLDNDLVRFEQEPNDHDLLSRIFRLMHTMKGSCGFLELTRLEQLAHHAENVLGSFRSGALQVTADHVTTIFAVIDRVRVLIASLEKDGIEPIGNDTDIILSLDAIASLAPKKSTFNAAASVIHADIADDAAGAGTASAPSGAPSTLRVHVDVLENVMTMVSELVLVRNQLIQLSRVHKKTDFALPLQRLNHIVSDLQESVMKTRMQPVGNVWAGLPRIVRDTALDLGKKINLVMRGQDTELDRQVLDMIKDPLTHMIRNAVDHGIESPPDRRAAGKSDTGTIMLTAFHQGGYVIIEITDDGQGLALDRILDKILQTGLASEAELAVLTPEQIYQYISRPGFSTATQVTALSGRGVGLDVVRTNIEQIGGSLDIQSTPGSGTQFRIRIPLTLAIVPALVVSVHGQRFAYPQLAIRELVMLSPDMLHRIEKINDTPVLRLRDQLLPLLDLRTLLEYPPTDSDTGQNRYVIVTQSGNTCFGIMVDRVYDTEEIVVKPMAKILKHIYAFSGTTILGDGSVIMILDPGGLAHQVGDVNNADTVAPNSDQPRPANEKTLFLIFYATDDGAPIAVPLGLVARLERFAPSKITAHGDHYIVQYGDTLMPIFPVNPHFTLHAHTPVPVMVFQNGNQQVGLIVHQIADIIEDAISMDIGSDMPGLMGSVIIKGRTMHILDLSYYLEKAHFRWLEDAPIRSESKGDKGRILLVDDSVFFRNMIQPFLKIAGYDVVAVGSSFEALKLQDTGEAFDLIISDIEMPEMDGYALATAIRTAKGTWADTPMLALTAHSKPEDITRSIEAGFQDHVGKFDRDSLLSRIHKTLVQSQDATR
ncbi:MAG: hybrid sensor histidine kinase/response regulator [Pseudomonadota bacterium]